MQVLQLFYFIIIEVLDLILIRMLNIFYGLGFHVLAIEIWQSIGQTPVAAE